MEHTYTILRDMSRATSREPFGGGGFELEGMEMPGEPRIDVLPLDKGDVRDVARDPEVRAVAPVMPTTLIGPVSDGDTGMPAATPAAAGPTWGVTAVGADTSTRTGAGVTVSILDTGIDATHPAFQGVTITERDFTGSGNGDKQGHGTHVAGTVFGRDVNGVRIGVAPGVTTALIGKVLGDDGSGSSDMLFQGIQWADQNGAKIISMSLGFDFPGLVKRLVDQGWPVELATSAALEAYRANLRMFDALMQLLQSRAAFSGGTLVVAAAGNESERGVDPDFEIGVSLPAAAEGVVSVGALAESAAGLSVAPFSNTFPQISAPGVAIESARAGGGLRSLNGTSMATPHVAGVAALWWEEVTASPLPAVATTVLSRLLANADVTALAANVDVADRGVGLSKAP
ncbi:S8 family peptidase [Jiangella mangrovi]|uniref:Subtilisin family serine protease n=1 Tax=Jiangella mangrovi TaxID=1524084 RepID=A0A7W9LND6_9ACTN|nr:S8 family serine peptidase [Jiangella mangrovi]MBB5790195.1 subtilisin family serine protease [Jiangella mangrovi]